MHRDRRLARTMAGARGGGCPSAPSSVAPVFSNLPRRDTARSAHAVGQPARSGLFGYAYQGARGAAARLRSASCARAGCATRLRLLGGGAGLRSAGERGWSAAARERGLQDVVCRSPGCCPRRPSRMRSAACDVLLFADAAGPSARKGTLAGSLASGRPRRRDRRAVHLGASSSVRTRSCSCRAGGGGRGGGDRRRCSATGRRATRSARGSRGSTNGRWEWRSPHGRRSASIERMLRCSLAGRAADQADSGGARASRVPVGVRGAVALEQPLEVALGEKRSGDRSTTGGAHLALALGIGEQLVERARRGLRDLSRWHAQAADAVVEPVARCRRSRSRPRVVRTRGPRCRRGRTARATPTAPRRPRRSPSSSAS